MGSFFVHDLLERLGHSVAVAVFLRPCGHPQKLIELDRLRHADRADDALEPAVRVGGAKILLHAFVFGRRSWISDRLPEIIIGMSRPLAVRPQEAERHAQPERRREGRRPA